MYVAGTSGVLGERDYRREHASVGSGVGRLVAGEERADVGAANSDDGGAGGDVDEKDVQSQAESRKGAEGAGWGQGGGEQSGGRHVLVLSFHFVRFNVDV